MLEVADDAGVISGSVTTEWYGPINLENARIEGDTLTFDLRNLNDKAHPTRRWTARFTAKGVKLSGDIWYAHVEQDGRRGGVKDAEARAFDFAPDLPPLGRDRKSVGWGSGGSVRVESGGRRDIK